MPEVQHDGATVACNPMQLGTDHILVHVDDACRRADRIAFCERTHCGLKHRRIGLQAILRCPVTQDHTRFARFTPRPRLPTAGTVLDHIPLRKGLPVTTTVTVRTVQGFPIHGLAPSCYRVFARGGTIN